jgi:hypothetical protein
VDYWGEYSDIMASVLQTISFTEPAEPTEPSPEAPADASATPTMSG